MVFDQKKSAILHVDSIFEAYPSAWVGTCEQEAVRLTIVSGELIYERLSPQ